MRDADNLSRRRFLEGTGAAATAAALAGCTGGGDDGDGDATTDAATSEQADNENRYRGVQMGTADSMDPVYATDTTSGRHIQNIFDGLMTYADGTINVEALLAEDYTVSEDGTVLTFQLKEGATYNDGTEVTASDFVYAWERLAASDNSNRTGFVLDFLGVAHEEDDDGEYVPGTLDVEATGDYELAVTLEEPFYAALELIAYSAFVAIPEGLLGDLDGYDGEMDYETFATANPVGAGPYELAEWSNATRIRLDARDDYHGDEIRNEGLDYSVFTESNAAYTYATSNVNADGPVIPSARFDPELRNFEGTDERGRQYGTYGPFEPNGMTADYYEVASLSMYYYAFDTVNVPKPVRRAVAYAMNQEAINDQVFPLPSLEGYFVTPPALYPGGTEAYEADKADFPYGVGESRLDEATAVMEDAGYGPNDTYELTFDMTSSTASSWGTEAFTLLRDKLQRAHIDLSQRTGDWSTFLNRGRNGDLELYYSGWAADYPGADNFLQLVAPQNTFFQDGGTTYMRWSDETGDAAGDAEEAWETIQNNSGPSDADTEARQSAFLDLERANWEDAVMIPFMHGIEQSYSYEWVDAPRYGAMGPTRKMNHTVEIGDRGEHQ